MDIKEPDVGIGPHKLLKGTGTWSVTLEGKIVAGPYGEAKTAARKARALNGATFLEDEPAPVADPAKLDKVSKRLAKAHLKPKAPKGERAPRDPEPKTARSGKVAKPAKPVVAAPDAPPELGELKAFTGTREEWLKAFTDKARVVFKQHDLEIPDKVRVSVGFMFRSPKAIGQCWHEAASADGHREVFINPTQADSSRVADILTHELCHTLFGPDEKHGKNFKAAVTKLGLEGKATATIAGEAWRAWAFPILRELGAIPHSAMDPSASGVKKQSTRLLKCECDTCGFIFRATAKHVNGKALHCPDFECVGAVRVEGADEGDEGE